ncbi:aminotransferase class V-fold PLP-dependent enzyme, partial [Candidatus Babeliales bacterium]|nr:aminotransferase class V-fold PLP-dependent enzyme [Candidatus Babeliales bacterium]
MNAQDIKKQFPIFSNLQNQNKNLVYVDSAATYQKPQAVIDAMNAFYTTSYASVHRGLYELGEQATEQYEAVRGKVAAFINAAHAEEIVFTKGATEGFNFIAQSWAEQNLQAGDEILLTQAEHHANLVPWQRVAQKTGAKLRFVPINLKTFMCDFTPDLITPKTKLVSVTYDSNVLGPIWPEGILEDIIASAHAVGARVMLDTTQAMIHEKINVQKLNADFVSFSGHKMAGPTGIGALYIKKELHDHVEPYQVGGSMVYSVSFEQATWAAAPQKFEAGTPAIAEVIGLGAAIDFLNQINFDALAAHEAALTHQLVQGLQKLNGVHIAGNHEALVEQGHLVSFWV